MTIYLEPRNFDTPYLLYSLKSRMISDVREMFGNNVEILFNRDTVHSRYSIDLYKHNVKQIKWTVEILQDIVDNWIDDLSGYCVIMSEEFCISGLPSKWINDIIPIINIDEHPTKLRDGRLYIKLDPTKDYNEIYDDLSLKITSYLRDKYDEGFVFDYNLIADDWNLESVLHGYYRPRWSNCLYAREMVSFLTYMLTSYEKGSKYTVSFNIGTKSNVVRHYIAQELLGCKFVSDKLIMKVSGYDDAERIAAIINDMKQIAQGVVSLKVDQFEGDYIIDDIHYPYIQSTLVE